MAANMQSSGSGDDVHIGFWINRANGPIYGATLTLSRQSGGLLIAFLAMYVGVTGKSFWKISRFILHSLLSSTALPDGIYHQRQAILRNSKSAPDAVEDILHAIFAWRKQSRRKPSRLFPVLVLAFVVTASFAIAGLFSSRVAANDANEVVLSGAACERNISLSGEQSPGIYELTWNRAIKVSEHLAYALECYQGWQADQPQRCQTFTKPSLPYTLDKNAQCPFSDTICRDHSNNLLLDSGLLDSYKDLGINVEPRFLFRLKYECAPLVTHGFSKLYNDSQNTSTQFMRYTYGRTNVFEEASNEDDSFVYQVPVNGLDRIDPTMELSPFADYVTRGMFARPDDSGIFIPVPELSRSDAEISLLFLSANGILSKAKIEDPWFAATKLLSSDIDNSTKYFISDEPAGVLGCSTQIWYCNPSFPEHSRCLNRYELDFLDHLHEIWPDMEDLIAIRGFLLGLEAIDFKVPFMFYNYPSTPSLLARHTLMGPEQWEALPSNQWQREMEYIYQATLASLQAAPVQISRRGTMWQNETFCPTATTCQKMCRNQKIKSPHFYSFSVLGVFIIVVMGLIVMILGYSLEPIAAFIVKLRGYKNSKLIYAWLEWETNSVLQLQRLAHEGLGLGTWSRTATSAPITEPDDKLGVLDLTDPDHPRLQHSVPTEEFNTPEPGDLDEMNNIQLSTLITSKTSALGKQRSLDPFYPGRYNTYDDLGSGIQNGLYSPLDSRS